MTTLDGPDDPQAPSSTTDATVSEESFPQAEADLPDLVDQFDDPALTGYERRSLDLADQGRKG
jgi:hypothetical protein